MSQSPNEHPELPPAEESASLPEFVEDSSFLRQFIFERRFRIAIAVALVFGTALAFFVPKWWTASPPGFVPVIHVSGLDKVQAWSLRRSARKYAAEGRLSEAVHAWRMAIVNDACDPENSRGLIRMLAEQEPPSREFLRVGIYQTRWLLRLTKTNLDDLGLSAKLSAHYGIDELVVGDLLPRVGDLDTTQAGELLKSLFHEGQMERFESIWLRQPALHTNATLRLYQAAWLAGWGPPGSIREGRDTLDAAKKSRETLLLANRLQLAVSLALNDLQGYEAALRVVEQEHQARVQDHVNYWRLLALAGRTKEAEELGRQFSNPPTTGTECLLMANFYADIGQIRHASEYIGTHLPTFAHRLDLWIRRAELLAASGNWESLRELAVEMRQVDGLRETAAGYAWFLEGLAELRRNRMDTAQRAFSNIVSAPLTDPLLGFRTAASISEVGHPEIARDLLNKLESEFGERAEYWYRVEMAAYGVGDIPGMLTAARKAYELAPDNPIIVNNYAAALIMMREQPSEAVKLTLKKLNENPGDVGAALNHCLALIQNRRLNEARAILVGLDPLKLQGVYSTVYHLANFELQYLEGNRGGALESVKRIEPRFLKPPQVKWLEETRRKVRDLRG